MASNSLTFSLERKQAQLMKQWTLRVVKLFNVWIEFEDTFKSRNESKQWISVTSDTATDEECQKAKSYILSIVDPDVSISMENKFLTKKMRDDIEKASAAHLEEQNGTVTIKGTEMSVSIAESLFLERVEKEKQKKSVTQNEHAGQGPGSRNLASTQSTPNGYDLRSKPVSHDLTGIRSKPRPVDPTPPPPDPSRFVPQGSHGRNAQSPARRSSPSPARRAMPNYARRSNQSQSPARRPTQSPARTNVRPEMFTFISDSDSDSNQSANKETKDRCIVQMSYLKNFGLSIGYSVSEVEETLFQFDINNIIKPAEFQAALSQLRQINQSLKGTASGKTTCESLSAASASSSDKSGTKSSSVHSLPSKFHAPWQRVDSSPIYLGSEKGKKEVIIISSDEENESGERQGPFANKTAGRRDNQSTFPQTPPPSSVLLPSSSSSLLPSSSSSSPTVTGTPAARPDNSHLRYIVIDGSNVAMSHGNNKVFSVRGIQICLQYFLSRGHSVTAFVPQSRLYSTNPVPIANKDLLQKLNEDGHLQFTPARRIGHRVITSYDDRYILNLAESEEGIVVSRDQFRDLVDEKPSYRNIIENRVLQYVFVGDRFMPPDDPLGRNGPTLDEFLRMPRKPCNLRSSVQQHRGQPRESVDQLLMHQLPGHAVGLPQNQTHNMGQLRRGQPPMRYPSMNQQGQGWLREVSQNTSAQSRISHTQPKPPVVSQQTQRPFSVTERSRQETMVLFDELKGIFPEEQQTRTLWTVLQNHKSEKDISTLSNYCLNAFSV